MNLYEEYAVLDAQIKLLTDQKDGLRVKILGKMIEAGEEKIETELGKFTAVKLKSWTYPDKVVELGEKFKTAKAKAESTGEAKYTESDSLRFTGTKI